ncbi:MAG: hypothetical protein KAH38_00125, partial [Candidatus Hydrogenedentes bacterium]|nr:hypothetical protein [Candidatus Hydrogenedentota bacterium]
MSPSTRVVTLLMGIFLLSFSCMGAQGVFTHEVPSTVLAEKAVVWGNPLADGPIRALVIAPRFTLGDVAQLAVRLEMQCETVALWSADSIGFDPMAVASLPDGGRREDILERIREGLDERLDVIVLANFDTDILPEAVFSKILDKVAGGTGLLLAHLQNGVDSPLHIVLDVLSPVDHGYPIWQGVGTCLFPGYTSLEGLSHVFSHGDGRVVVLEYLGDPPHNHCLIQPPADPLDMDPLYEDNAYSFVARAVGVAARRFDEIRIDALYDRAPQGPQDDEIPPDFYPEFVQAMRDSVVAQPARPFQMTFNKPTDRRYTVRAQLRRVASNVVISWHDSESLPKGTTAHQFEIPVGSGAYTMDVWLHDRSGIVDWYSKDFNLSGWPEFQELKLEKTWLLPNDSLDFSLEVRPVANHRRTATIYARAVDEYDRVVSEAYAEVDHQGGTLNLRLHFSDLLSTLLKVEVFAVEGRKRILSEWELHASYREVRYLSVRQHAVRGSMDVVALGEAAREYIPLHYLRCLSDMGITWAHVPAG